MANKNDEKNLQVTTTGNLDVLSGLQGLESFKAQKGEDIGGLEVVDQTDIKLPKIKIAQLTSKEVSDGIAKPGQFINTVTGKVYDKLPATLLVLGKSRVMWKQPFKRGEEPLCRSLDGKMKWDGRLLCANCEYQDWDKAKAAGKNKPDCNMSYVWLGLTMDEQPTPFRMIAAGKSVGTTKNFINEIFPKKYPPFIYNVVLTTTKETNESGTFFVLQYEIVGVASSMDEAKSRQDLAEGMKDLFTKAIEIDTMAVDDETAHSAESDIPSSQGQLF